MTLVFNKHNNFPALKELRLSYSSLTTYETCARKLEFKKFYSIPGENVSLAGEVGHALHDGWQDYIIHGDREHAIGAMMLSYPIHLNDDPSHDRSLEACYATLNAMIDSTQLLEYEVAEIHCLDGQIRKGVEVPFRIDIKNFSLSDDEYIPVYFVGFIDLILRHRIDGTFTTTDIKTHRLKPHDLTAKYMYDDQCIPYGLVLERALGQEIESFFTRYYSVYVDIQKPHCKLYKFPKNKNDIHDWARGFYIHLQNIKTYYQLGWFPRNGNSCMSWNRPCEFFDTCNSRDPGVIEMEIASKFKNPYQDRYTEPWIHVELELAA